MKKILDVVKVAFYGKTGDDRSPESFALPACLTSLAEAMDGHETRLTIHASNRDYTKRPLNDEVLAASGMAFALLWDKEHCPSALDVSQITDLSETLTRAFDRVGYAFEAVNPQEEDMAQIKARTMRSIDAGVPMLGFGLFDPPECALIAGYDEDGDVLIGYSHFQNWAGLTFEPNGMFRVHGWEKDCWTLVFPGEKTERKLTEREIVAHGLDILEKTSIDRYLAGQAAYDEWIACVETAGALPEEEQKALYKYHHDILFSLAELRCWGANFLREANAKDAAECFQAIHNACWKCDAAAKGDGYFALKSADRRAAIIAVLKEIQALDKRAADEIRAYLRA